MAFSNCKQRLTLQVAPVTAHCRLLRQNRHCFSQRIKGRLRKCPSSTASPRETQPLPITEQYSCSSSPEVSHFPLPVWTLPWLPTCPIRTSSQPAMPASEPKPCETSDGSCTIPRCCTVPAALRLHSQAEGNPHLCYQGQAAFTGCLTRSLHWQVHHSPCEHAAQAKPPTPMFAAPRWAVGSQPSLGWPLPLLCRP